MRKMLAVALFGASLGLAQSPSLPGVWKADLQKSKLAGPPIKDYLEIIEAKTYTNPRTKETAPELDETIGMWGERGEQRTLISFLTNGKPVVRPYQGIPTRLTATTASSGLTLTGEVAGRPSTFKRSYELSSDGQTLTINFLVNNDGKQQESTIVLTKQPDSAGDVLRKPEQTAGEHFKNVKTEALKTLPESEFINQMRYIAWSLGKDCEFCHVKGHFDSDDKKEKKTARKMVDMVASIDANNFEGHPAVRCFTCHEGHEHPPSRPPFADEAAKPEPQGQPGPTGAQR